MPDPYDYGDCPICGNTMDWVEDDGHTPSHFECSRCCKELLDGLKLVYEQSQVKTALHKALRDTEGFYEGVLTLPTSKSILFKNPTIIAFDSEFDGDTLLTIQLAKGRGQSKMYVIKEPVLRLRKFAECLQDFSGLEKGSIRLITHWGNAEARYLEDFFHNFRNIMQIQSGLSYSGKVGPFTIVVKDLFSLYPMGLDKIGKAVGVSKASLDGIGGKRESYWKAHMSEFLEKYPAEFEAYAKTDAEITATAFTALRNKYLWMNSIEILPLPTMPSIAFADLRRNFLKKDAAPWILDEQVQRIPDKTRPGEYKDAKKYVIIFDGDLNVRKYAGLASWGALNSLFWFGYRREKEPFAQYRDVKSLYVAAALLQPLPNIDTDWVPVRDLDDIKKMEGFARVTFKFKDDENFPNLACQCNEMPGSAIFPLQGTTYETFSQIRQAVRFGAEISNTIKGYGFKPTSNEIDHDLGNFLRPMFEAKEKAPKGSLEAQNFKLQMVALIGRFNLKLPKEGLSSKIRHFKRSGLGIEEYISTGRTKEFRLKDKADKTIAGSGFAPEWSSLILGKARALISGICHIGGCFHIATDGGFFLRERIPEIMQSPEVAELQSVGSDLRIETPDEKENPEGLVDEVFVSRTRFYSLWYQGVVIHQAHQGIHTKKSFDQMLRANIAALSPVVFELPNMSLSKVRDVLDGLSPRLSEPIYGWGNVSYHRDYKRRFEPISVRSLENPFTADIWTKPHREILDAFRWQQVTRDPNLTSLEKVKLLSEPSLIYNRGRPTKERLIEENVRRLKQKGLTEREIAEELGLSRSKVHRKVNQER